MDVNGDLQVFRPAPQNYPPKYGTHLKSQARQTWPDEPAAKSRRLPSDASKSVLSYHFRCNPDPGIPVK